MKLSIEVKTGGKNIDLRYLTKSKLQIKLTAPAKDGKANKQLVEVLSDHLDIPKSRINILKGLTSSHKIVEIL
ncbi:MAG: DUF167 domain-containing protein [Parcubacteria group bacterium]